MNTNKMQNFLGKSAVEDDEGWSEEVWRAGYRAAVADMIMAAMFQRGDTFVVPGKSVVQSRRR